MFNSQQIDRILNFTRTEPVVIGGLVVALVALGVSFATHPSNEWQGAIQGVILAGTTLLTAWRVRATVYSPATVAAMSTFTASPSGLPGGGDAGPTTQAGGITLVNVLIVLGIVILVWFILVHIISIK